MIMDLPYIGIFTDDSDQRSNFLGFEFRESVFLGGIDHSCCIFGLLNKICILKCFIFSTVFFGSSFIHQVLQ